MTAKADFTEEEWNVVREGPAAAGMMVLMAHSGGRSARPGRSPRPTRKRRSSPVRAG